VCEQLARPLELFVVARLDLLEVPQEQDVDEERMEVAVEVAPSA
jgi:hypothetical protein